MFFAIQAAPIHSLSDAAAALQTAALGHSDALNIGHDRMLRDYGCLWMLMRSRISLSRLPIERPRVETFLRRPRPTASVRDFTVFDGDEVVGTAVQTWVLADAQTRRLVNLKHIDCLFSLPAPTPERTELPERFALPDSLPIVDRRRIRPDEIDENGHLNNVCYIRRAEGLFPAPQSALTIHYERECFADELLTLEASPDGCVRGVRENGEISFRAQFRREIL